MKTSRINISHTLMSFLISSVLCTSCRKFVEVPAPSTSTNGEIVYSTDITATAVMTGLYAQMNTLAISVLNGGPSLSVYPELSADNLTLFATNNSNYSLYYRNVLSPFTSAQSTYWEQMYSLIYRTNSVIEGAGKSKTLSKGVKDQLMGEAYFMRAFFYFYLVNLYGDVPLVLTTAYKESATLGRSSLIDANQQITEDLITAQSLLNVDYVDATLLKPTAERSRPTKFAATALLARQYLFTGDYINAEIQSTNVIENNDLFGVIPLNQMFKKNSRETIWALQPIGAGLNTQEAWFYTLPVSGPNAGDNPVYLSDKLIESFEIEDHRKDEWLSNVVVDGKVYPFAVKYKIVEFNAPVDEHSIVLRLAEQYLIRAEARAQQSNISGSQKDLKVIRERSGLGGTDAASKNDLLNAIIRERRTEFFTEWGHRWFDLKRTGKINVVMEAAAIDKGTTWKPEYQLYPIPGNEIKSNTNLIQNPGY
jgi:starch-binding outer membrane protein, SusD/RagB family